MRPSCLSFIQWMPIEPLTHTPSHMLWCDVRANLFIPLLIISFNLKKHGWLWHYLVSRLPLGYALHLVFSMWGENEGWGNGGYGSAEKEKRYRTRGKSRERWHWPMRDGCKYSERPCQCHSLCTHVDRGKMAVTRCNLMDWFTLEPDGLSFQLVLVSSVWNHEFPPEVLPFALHKKNIPNYQSLELPLAHMETLTWGILSNKNKNNNITVSYCTRGLYTPEP